MNSNARGADIYRINEFHKTIESTSPYTIMMGDYNLNLGSSLPYTVTFDKYGHVIKEDNPNACFTVHNMQNEKSTLRSNLPELANSYDHFTMDTRAKNYILNENSIRVVDGIHQNTKKEDDTEEKLYNRYRSEVSDHLPIVVEVDI